MPSLYKHQQDLLDRNPSRYGIFWEMGTGKTLTAIRLAERNATSPLVVCPKSLVDQWRQYIKTWHEKEIPFTVMSKETLRRDYKKVGSHDCLILDEAHNWSNATSLLHKHTMYWLAKHNPPFIYLLTGTPYMSSAMNLYALERLLGRNPSWYEYRTKFFYQVKMGQRVIPMQKDGIEAELKEILDNMGQTVRLQDCVDVPDQVFETEYFNLTREQENAIFEVETTGTVPIVKWTKIHEICGGSLKGDGYVETKHFDTEKLERLKELARENDKLIVVCRYNAEVERIAKELDGLFINGSVKDRNAVIRKAEEAKKCVLVVQSACCEGWQLKTFDLMIFYSYSFSLKDCLQMRGRISRIDNPKKNVYLSLIVKNSIDEEVFDCIVNKKLDFHIELFNPIHV